MQNVSNWSSCQSHRKRLVNTHVRTHATHAHTFCMHGCFTVLSTERPRAVAYPQSLSCAKAYAVYIALVTGLHMFHAAEK